MSRIKHYTSVREIRGKVEDLYEKGISKGFYCGFPDLYNHYSPKIGYSTYLFANFASGKTEFWFELMISLSELYGLKHAILSVETGTATEIAAELISKAAKRQFFRNSKNPLSQSELYKYMDWVDHHFYIISPDETSISVPEFYQQVDDIESEYQVKVSMTVADPFNELHHDLTTDGRQDLYIERILGDVNRNARLKQRHNCVITHSSKQEIIKAVTLDGKEVRFNPPPHSKEISGGEGWSRKAMCLLSLWRPPANIMCTELNRPYMPNELWVNILKYKPKFSGQRGTVIFYLDVERNRYYQLDGDRRIYSSPMEKTYEQKKHF